MSQWVQMEGACGKGPFQGGETLARGVGGLSLQAVAAHGVAGGSGGSGTAGIPLSLDFSRFLISFTSSPLETLVHSDF